MVVEKIDKPPIAVEAPARRFLLSLFCVSLFCVSLFCVSLFFALASFACFDIPTK